MCAAVRTKRRENGKTGPCDAVKDEGGCWRQTVQVLRGWVGRKMHLGGQDRRCHHSEDLPAAARDLRPAALCCIKQPTPTKRRPLNEICTQVPQGFPLLHQEPAPDTAVPHGGTLVSKLRTRCTFG